MQKQTCEYHRPRKEYFLFSFSFYLCSIVYSPHILALCLHQNNIFTQKEALEKQSHHSELQLIGSASRFPLGFLLAFLFKSVSESIYLFCAINSVPQKTFMCIWFMDVEQIKNDWSQGLGGAKSVSLRCKEYSIIMWKLTETSMTQILMRCSCNAHAVNTNVRDPGWIFYH